MEQLLNRKEILKRELSSEMSRLARDSRMLSWKYNGLFIRKRNLWEALQESLDENASLYGRWMNRIKTANLPKEIEFERESLKEYEKEQKARKIRCKEISRELAMIEKMIVRKQKSSSE